MSSGKEKRARLQRAMSGEPVDRLPISLWRHFYVEETAVEPLAARLAQWHRRFDFDFVKINVRAQYHTEGWGAQYRYSGEEHVKPEPVSRPVEGPKDFAELDVLDPWSWPLGEMLELIKKLRGDLGPDEVLLMTVFNPMSIALDLAGGPDRLAAAIKEDTKSVHKGLRAITDTFRDFATGCLDQGADGLFFATTAAATAENFALEQYEEFGRPYDLEVLDAAGGAFMNMLHVCKERSFVRQLGDYPVQAVNWDTNHESTPTLMEMRGAAMGKALVGGLSRELFDRPGVEETLVQELAAARAQMNDRLFIAGSTCTIPTTTREENIDAVCRVVRGEG